MHRLLCWNGNEWKCFYACNGQWKFTRKSNWDKSSEDSDELEALSNTNDGVLIEAMEKTDDIVEVIKWTTEFLPLVKAKSHVWNYFGFPACSGECIEKDKHLYKEVFCIICEHSLSYKGT